MMKTARAAGLSLGLLLSTGCAVNSGDGWSPPKLAKPTPAQAELAQLPRPESRIPVAVYSFTDQTGQFKPSDSVQTLSRAVTQGATSILVKALQDAGNREWFMVVERERLDNLLRERAIIREMRQRYLGEQAVNPRALPPLLFAGTLLEGGIIGYDTNVRTGGLGARYLGIGGKTEYREDTITVYLRAISVQTGEVLVSTVARKSIMSVGIGANAFRFIGFKDLLEFDAGITYNEPDQLALQQAVEKAVHSLIMEGALIKLWCFGDKAAGDPVLQRYREERGATLPVAAPNGNRCRSDMQAAAQPLPAANATVQRLVPSGTDEQVLAPAQPRAVVPASRPQAQPPVIQGGAAGKG